MTTPESKPTETPQEAPQQQPVETQKEVEKPQEIVQEQATTVTPGQIAAQAADDATQAQQTPADDQTITITIPATTQQLEDWSKGSPDDSITWLAFFWIRLIKKALFHGWRVITQPAIPNA